MIATLLRAWRSSVAALPRLALWAGWGLIGTALLSSLAGCSPNQPVRIPQATAVHTPTALPTSTPTPAPTATPTPTPTPPAAQPAGILPAGQVYFSTRRAGEGWAELWQADPQKGVAIFQPEVVPGLWECGVADSTRCVFVTWQGALQASWPTSGTLALLDDLSLLRGGHAEPSLNMTGGLSATTSVSTAHVITESLVLSDTGVMSAAVPISTAVPISATNSLSTSVATRLALSPDGTALALAGADGITIYDLESLALAATVQVTDTTAQAWSPDSSALAISYPGGDDVDALTLWRWREGTVRLLASMQSVGDLAWSPDGAKLAFRARRQPLAPASQGSQSDVFVLFLKSGEIANLTEVFLGNNGLPAEQQIAGWAPSWEPDSSAVRYVLGVPGEPDTQSVMRHTLRSRRPTIFGSAPGAESSGHSTSPSGQVDARFVQRDGRQIVQTRTAGGDWSDVSPGTLDGIHSLQWAPRALLPSDTGDGLAERYVLLVARQALYVLDITNGSIGGVAVACSDCAIDRAVWLP